MSLEREIFFRHLGLPSANPSALEIDRAEGIWLYGPGGKRYADLVSGVAVSNVGHRHPVVIRAIKEQLEKHLHLMVYGELVQSPQVKLAQKLTSLLPGKLDCVYFVNSGSEAIEGSLKLARRSTGRKEMIAFRNAYHGGTLGALSICGNDTLKKAFEPLLPGIRTIDFNDPEGLKAITEETACVVMETIQAEAGIILPDVEFLHSLRKKCDLTGTLLIIDDIQMGFGRTGKIFSFEHFGIIPDILALAKGMGGGMPIGAFISGREIMRSLTHDPELGHITTFGGHPVSCAAALASLEVILNEKLSDSAHSKGSLFKEKLSCHPEVKEIRQTGLMLAVEMHNTESCGRIQQLLLQNGLITDRFLFMPEAFRIAPPLAISTDEIEWCSSSILKCFDLL